MYFMYCNSILFHKLFFKYTAKNAVLLSWQYRLKPLASILAPRPESCIDLDSKSQHAKS